MPFATIDEAWGNVKPYINNNPILENTPDKIVEIKPNLETVRVKPEFEVETEIKGINDKYQSLEGRIDSSVFHLKEDIRRLNRKLDSMLNNRKINVKNEDFVKKNINDIILYMIFGLIVMLVVDIIFKLAKNKLGK